MSLLLLYFFLIPRVFSLNFNITNFTDNSDRISVERSASLNGTSIVLVRQHNQGFGQVTYKEPMHLWDKATGKVTDFTTRFNFTIDSNGSTTYGDGMAFFLIPKGANLSNTNGGSMGLIYSAETMFNSTDHPYVAVEFDIYSNEWDPKFVHVGVDINSVLSDPYAQWYPNITGGGTNEAFISYNANTHNLSISFTNGFDPSKNTRWQHLHKNVDLKQYLPEWVTFGFSASTGLNSASHEISAWSFYTEEYFPNVAPSRKSQTSRNGIALATGLGGAGGLVLVCVAVWFFLWKKKKRMEDDESHENTSDDFEGGMGPKKYSYAQLARAANNFKDEHKLGQGGFGSVYKGFLRDSNSYVAIKRISEASKQGKKEFTTEIRIISQLRHRNLVQLIGWCHERKKLLLVYEYMANGSLESHLFKDKKLLTWPIRFKIAQGMASALLYLHEEWEQCVVHRDIKASNIMLDSDFNAKLGDFGLARLVDHIKGAQTTALAGTVGYMAPECVITGKASKESDVYSFGVVILEIVCGRKPINPMASEDETNIVNWVWNLYGSQRIFEAVDPRLQGDFEQDQAECLMIVGLWCAHPDHNRRPTIRQAIHVLNSETPFPSLPSTYPTPSYNDFPTSFSALSCSSTSVVSQNQHISSSSNTNSSGFTPCNS